MALVAESGPRAPENFIVEKYGKGIGKSVQDCSQSPLRYLCPCPGLSQSLPGATKSLVHAEDTRSLSQTSFPIEARVAWRTGRQCRPPAAPGPGLPCLFISFLAVGDEQARSLIISGVCVRAQVVGDEDFS